MARASKIRQGKPAVYKPVKGIAARFEEPKKTMTEKLEEKGYFKHPNEEILEGLPAIGAYMNRSPDTIKRWIRKYSFPVGKLPTGHWFTTVRLIDSWCLATNKTTLDGLKAKAKIMEEEALSRSIIDEQ